MNRTVTTVIGISLIAAGVLTGCGHAQNVDNAVQTNTVGNTTLQNHTVQSNAVSHVNSTVGGGQQSDRKSAVGKTSTGNDENSTTEPAKQSGSGKTSSTKESPTGSKLASPQAVKVPNPASLPSGARPSSVTASFDQHGKLVKSKDVSSSWTAKGTTVVPPSDLAHGTYQVILVYEVSGKFYTSDPVTYSYK